MKTIKLLSKDNETIQEITVDDTFFTESMAFNVKQIFFPHCEKTLGEVTAISVDGNTYDLNTTTMLHHGMSAAFYELNLMDDKKITKYDNAVLEFVEKLKRKISYKDERINKLELEIFQLAAAVFFKEEDQVKKIIKKYVDENKKAFQMYASAIGEKK